MGGCLSVEVIAESAPSSPIATVTTSTPRNAQAVTSSPGNQRTPKEFSPRTPRGRGDNSETDSNGAGGNGRGGGGDGYGGAGNLAAPQSVPVGEAGAVITGTSSLEPVTSDPSSSASAAHSFARTPSAEANDGRGTARKFRLHELRAATSSFNKKALLGRGSFGEVYLGKLAGKESGEVVEVAVKKLNPESSQGLDEWLAEIVLLRKLHHPNLVELLGFCAEKGEALLVYGLCTNGSLDDRLFPRTEEEIIDWPTRVRIAQGAAQGLLHLHEHKVIHRDLKPSNILLDKDMHARITDFGMAKQAASSMSHISTRVMGTMGYLDPEYMETGCLRDKSDVYSLGVILLQMLTGRDAVAKEGNIKLVRWMAPHLYPNVTEPDAWIDPNLQGRFSRRGAMILAAVAKQCSARHKEDRPEMTDVAQALMEVPLEC
ncbi:hypothetical protein CLOP_g119 [Closterium sp. NIES-67]|nr:hypothetical protein CLOP_g119 [Closterium sp. NIES-67]